ncbi:MAG TPA: galactose-1-phosphate uridylyltransferase [Chloroflexota bacterium]|nr:galactose-1-phosphate uridylyltransferase [Chloroflexota bacterium]
MSQLRQDPVTGSWVAIATERAKRPTSFQRAPVSAGSNVSPTGKPCPFCEGHEAETPPELQAIRPAGSAPNTPGWYVRVVPNLYPAFAPSDQRAVVAEEGIYRVMAGIGEHEVIVLSPSHTGGLDTLSDAALLRVVQTYVSRYQTLCTRESLQYLMIISNHGREAGASLAHPHSQLLGLPIIPPAVQAEIDGVARYRDACGRCIYCEIVRYELASGTRVVYTNDDFLVYAPFAGRLPFETSIIPRWHAGRFEAMTLGQQRSFADTLHNLARRASLGLGDPPYNLYIHTAPCHVGPDFDYHWHLEFLPRLTIQAGFEWGSGIMINTVAPEDAAAFLRDVKVVKRRVVC